jgi:ribonucleoside-diphosphate reductase beta chain
MEMLLPYAIGVVNEIFSGMDPIPFGLDKEEFVQFAMKQFQTRMDILERARGKTIDEIYSVSEDAVGVIE